MKKQKKSYVVWVHYKKEGDDIPFFFNSLKKAKDFRERKKKERLVAIVEKPLIVKKNYMKS